VLFVAVVAVAAVAVVAGVVLSSDGDSAGTAQTTTAGLREGRPPLSFALGFRTDPEARDLTQGQALYASGDTAGAAKLFARHDSLEAKVGAAFAAWPEGSLDRLEQLAKLYPGVAVVQLHLGLARLWANEGDPVAAWRAVLDAQPDTPYAVVAGNLLHPELPRGLPAFIPSFSASPAITSLPPARQLEALRLAAGRGGLRAPPRRRSLLVRTRLGGTPPPSRHRPASRAPCWCGGVRSLRVASGIPMVIRLG